MNRQILHRRPSSKYLLMSMLWIFPSIGALVILSSEIPDLLKAPSFFATLEQTRLEGWIAAALLGLHAFFLTKAWRLRNEPFVPVVVYDPPNPDSNPRNLSAAASPRLPGKREEK